MTRLTDLNFARDPRNCEADAVPVLFLEDGAEQPLPTMWAVCPVCRGNGTHVNPSIDCDGITAEDFAEDPDFEEDYRAGAYDVTCARCQGRTTVHEVDWDRLSPDQASAYRAQLRDEASTRAEELAEVRAGA